MDSDKATLFFIRALRAPTIIEQVVDRIDKSDVGSLHRHNRLADRPVVFRSFDYTKSKERRRAEYNEFMLPGACPDHCRGQYLT